MKTSFEFSLKGRDWWGPFLGFWVIFLAIYIPQVTMTRWGPSSTQSPGLYFLLTFVFLFLIVIIQSIFTIVLARIIVPKLSYTGKSFGFNGEVGKFLGMNLLGLFLSIITIGIYAPWYIRKIAAYLVSETTYDGTSGMFFGKGGKLFVYLLLSVGIPIVIVSVIMVIAVYSAGGDLGSGSAGVSLATGVMMLVIFVVLTPYMYLIMKWYVNLGWKDLTTAWDAKFWPSCGFLLGQILLTIITIGIYGPAAVVRCYRYFAPKIALRRGDVEAARFGFEGSIGKGFGLIWGQSLLSIITFGIYIPWAYARIGSWMASQTFLETKE
jgi:uncharacterized membrane protein YjgN (DUF898 family)